MLNLQSPEVLRLWHAATQHRDVANTLLRVQKRGVTRSIEAYHAVYIGGYAVECALKALILSRAPRAQHRDVIAGRFRELGHNLLGCFDSLKVRWGLMMPRSIHAVFRKDVAAKWRTDMRYSAGQARVVDARRLLDGVNAVLNWIQGVR